MCIAVRHAKPLMSLPLSFNIDSLVWLLAWRQYARLGIGDPLRTNDPLLALLLLLRWDLRARVCNADLKGTQTCRRPEPTAPRRGGPGAVAHPPRLAFPAGDKDDVRFLERDLSSSSGLHPLCLHLAGSPCAVRGRTWIVLCLPLARPSCAVRGRIRVCLVLAALDV